MIKKSVNIQDIRCPELFLKSIPSSQKIEKRKNDIIKSSNLTENIIIREDGFLMDGFTTYLASKELELEMIRCTVLSYKEAIKFNASKDKTHKKKSSISINQPINGECYICGRKCYTITDERYDGTNLLTLDHKIPKSKGGKDTKENLLKCCNICNGLKGDFSYSEELKDLILRELKERGII